MVLQQLFLALVCLPILVLSFNWLQDAFSCDGAAFHALAQNEKDGKVSHLSRDHHGSDSEGGEDEQNFNQLYYLVYGLSILVFVAGFFMYVSPQPGLLRPVTGTLLFACGIFLLMNSDLIVTYVRLHEQVRRFKINNERFQQNLEKQSIEVRRLQTAAKGLEEIDRKFGGSVERAMKEVQQLETAVRANIGMNCKELCRLYLDKDKDRHLGLKELDESLDMMATIFGAIMPDLRLMRLPKLKQVVSGHPRFLKDGGLTVPTFVEVFECALFAHEPSAIATAVKKVLDDLPLEAGAGKLMEKT